MQTTPDTEEVISQLEQLTLGDWVLAATILVVSVASARVLAFVVRRLLARTPASDFAQRLVGRVVGFLVVVLGLVYALVTIRVEVGPLLGILGLAGVALAFAFQNILENFIAGVLMLIRRPLRVGDQVATNQYEGTVHDITLRTVLLVTFDGESVHIPNSMVWQNPFVNYTERGLRRTTLMVGVAYDSDLDRCQQLLVEAAASVEGVASRPGPEALVTEFADSAVSFAVRFWHAPDIATLWRVRDEVARTVKRRLDQAGIVIPFPQRVVWLRSQG